MFQHEEFPLDSGVTHVPGGKNATHYVRNTRLGRSITWAVDPGSCVSMKNDTREHYVCIAIHRIHAPSSVTFHENVYTRGKYMRASCTIPWILTYHLPCDRILGAIICFDRDSRFLGGNPARDFWSFEIGSKKEGKKIFCLQNSIKKLGSILFLIIDLGSVA